VPLKAAPFWREIIIDELKNNKFQFVKVKKKSPGNKLEQLFFQFFSKLEWRIKIKELYDICMYRILDPVRINQLPVSVARWQHGFPDLFCNF
jgi:hypothetical protein